ncbi:hypothetical protein HELRODRAFT_175257 [Helobdella robusta]|uniref:C-type lectin domain-containing protein n=1 Tax=Helobdella robusta TaxID=6412 RepID=T1F925_HELRO|nr:hypothetical protein HELRODRAFT_175257 [Helobdella robusta]ESO00778.1 hypothetical protein HELRODRAFT_175257 [Helobdella robusta]
MAALLQTELTRSVYPNQYTYFIGGIRTYVNGSRDIFYWSPYPGVFRPLESNAWVPGERKSAVDERDFCVLGQLSARKKFRGLDNVPCSAAQCLLCEFDMIN